MALDAELGKAISEDFRSQNLTKLNQWSIQVNNIVTLLHNYLGENPIDYAVRNRLRLSLAFILKLPIEHKTQRINQLISISEDFEQQHLCCLFFGDRKDQSRILAHINGLYRA